MRLLGKDHPDTLQSMNNLAIVYRDQGLLMAALDLANEACQLDTKMLGSLHPQTLSARDTLGMVYRDMQGQLCDAVKLFKSVLELRKSLLGHHHFATLESAIHLGRAYIEQGKFDKGIELEENALQAPEKVLGRQHSLRFEAMNDLGVAYLRQGRLAKAFEIHIAALRVLKVCWALNIRKF